MRRRHLASEKMVALRRAAGMTQTEFAEILGTSVVTIARYETSSPPAGLILLKLAFIAVHCKRPDLSEDFSRIFWEESCLPFVKRLASQPCAQKEIA